MAWSNKNQTILELYKSKVMPTYEPSLVIAGGKGITVRDVDGMSYYDFTRRRTSRPSSTA